MSASPNSAACRGCGKRFRVPDDSRRYSCPACGGAVAAAQPAAAACRACGDALEPGAGFCSSCGASVDAGRRSAVRREERRRASAELVRAAKLLGTLRVFYLLNAGLYAVGAVSVVLLFGDASVPVGVATLGLLLTAGVTALMVVGAIQLRFRPFLWAVLLASLVTVTRLIHAYLTGFPLVWTVVGAVWALAFWAMAVPMARVRRLVREHPDLRISSRILGDKSRTVRRGIDAEELYAHAAARARRRSLVAVAVIAGLSVFGAAGAYQGMRTPSFDAAWAEFAADWEHGDLEDVVAWFPPDQRADARRWLRSVEYNRDWGVPRPATRYAGTAIADPSAGDSRVRVVRDREFSGGTVAWTFLLEDGRWFLSEVELPEPGFQAVAEHWNAAWDASDLEALAGSFVDSGSAVGSLRRMVEKQGWAGLPAIGRERIFDGARGRRTVYLWTAKGEVVVQWRLVDDVWRAESVHPPTD